MGTSLAIAIAALLVPLSVWFNAVHHEVTTPYLDEVFHVRQAQHYCKANFHVWDPKITTPPGLYVLSYLFSRFLGCSITSLRLINAVCLILLLIVLYGGYVLRRKGSQETGTVSKLSALHSALNLVLFPPLFFFSALYYTDVASTLSVFIYLYCFLRSFPTQWNTPGPFVLLVILGVVSLSFRQTNIFWVAVAPAGLALIVQLDQGHGVVKGSMHRHAGGFGDTIINVAKTSWKYETLYDPPVRDSWLEDFVRTIVSIAACGLRALTQPKRALALLEVLVPFITIMGLFVAFIFWNGSVVLGDKSNHVATINLPQMFYYWSSVVFFSWPLVLPYLLLVPLMIVSRIGSFAHLEPFLYFKRRYFLPRLRLIVLSTLLACAVVKVNTTVHPFMLADNRHYVFYVFKRLLRPWWVRYTITPLYVFSAWAYIEARGEPPTSVIGVPDAKQETSKKTPDRLRSSSSDEEITLRLPDGKTPVRTSFVIVSLVTTALQICTAPLVEPRYFIVPWMIWRMHLPLRSIEQTDGGQTGKMRTWAEFMSAYDYRVVLETVWFLFINATTGYIFLNWKFTWLSQPGANMRFMW